MDLQIELVDTIRPDVNYGNYDHRKFSVKDENGKFLTFVFEHAGEFLNLRSSEFFPSKEAAANAAIA